MLDGGCEKGLHFTLCGEFCVEFTWNLYSTCKVYVEFLVCIENFIYGVIWDLYSG